MNEIRQFLERLQGVNLEEDKAMISFHVTVLFASIDSDLTKKIGKELLEEHFPDKPTEILKVCLCTYFKSNVDMHE